MEQINKQNNYLIKLASYSSVSAAVIIIIIKSIGWFLTGSISIMALLVDSVLDVMSSIISLVAVHYALLPADDDHRFGHGKAEDLAVLTQSYFFAISSIFIIITAIKNIIYPHQIIYGDTGIIVISLSILVTTILITFQKYVIYKTKSFVIIADNLHYVTDLLTHILTIVAIILTTNYQIYIADPVFALIIACYLLYSSWKLLWKAFDKLMDREASETEKQVIKNVILRRKNIKGFHDLKTRYSGNKFFIQFHLELDGKISLNKAHVITEELEQELLKTIPNSEVIIHQDPYGVDEVVRYKD